MATEWIKENFVKHGDKVTIHKKYVCGCIRIFAKNSFMYDGGDYFNYYCNVCKKNPDQRKNRVQCKSKT